MGDDRCANRCRHPYAARVVVVLVRIDRVSDRTAGAQLQHLLDDRDRASVIERTLDQDHVVAHPDRDAIVRAARQEPDAICDLFHGDDLARGAHGVRHCDVGERIWLDRRHANVERRKAADRLLDSRRKQHRPVLAISAVARDSRDLAGHHVGNGRLHALDDVVGVDEHSGVKASRLGECNHRRAAAIRAPADHRRLVAQR